MTLGVATKMGESDFGRAAQTSGMKRKLVKSTDTYWAGVVETEPNTASGWHHHDGYDTLIFVTRGRMRIESGPGGRHVVEAVSGEVINVPPGVVHREVNPIAQPGRAIVIRVGSGDPVVNVDGPSE